MSIDLAAGKTLGKGRLAPSPTGAQHLGNARTYLIAFWSARHAGSRIALRIEDVDSPRIKPWAVGQAIEDLRWLGIHWDEGPDIGGPVGPYVQTERIDLYRAALRTLIDRHHVYPCVCTRKDILEAGSAPHYDHESPVYAGTCSAWRPSDPLPPEGQYCWRFRASDGVTEFDDAVMGHQACVVREALGDFPVSQKNGEPSYQLAVVVDDAAMGITEVVRGNDLIASTFRQLDLYAALGHVPPTFAHVPLVRGPDNRRLAKRHGDTRLSHLREQGIAPEEVVRWAIESSGLVDPAGRFDWSKLNPADVIVPRDFLVD